MPTLKETIDSLYKVIYDQSLPEDVRTTANSKRYYLEYVCPEGKALKLAREALSSILSDRHSKDFDFRKARHEFEKAEEKAASAEMILAALESVPCPEVK